jgi:hypothetical protein
LFREFVAGKRRREDAHDRDVALAWRIESLARHKTLPKLETLLSKRSERQTAAQQKGQLHVLSEMYGIPLRKASA